MPPPKFQSSFIPKGPISSGAPGSVSSRFVGYRDLLSTLAGAFFSISVILALGVFVYNYWLDYSIGNMSAGLDQARISISPETVNELVRLDKRISSTEKLVKNHQVLSPVFELLESSTPATVRFTSFDHSTTEKGRELSLRGEATSYAALALQADVFNNTEYFKDPVFSDLSLDLKGNVLFSMTTTLDPTLLSYQDVVETFYAPEALIIGESSTTTATTTPN